MLKEYFFFLAFPDITVITAGRVGDGPILD